VPEGAKGERRAVKSAGRCEQQYEIFVETGGLAGLGTETPLFPSTDGRGLDQTKRKGKKESLLKRLTSRKGKNFLEKKQAKSR